MQDYAHPKACTSGSWLGRHLLPLGATDGGVSQGVKCCKEVSQPYLKDCLPGQVLYGAHLERLLGKNQQDQQRDQTLWLDVGGFILTPRSTVIVSSSVPKKLLLAGINCSCTSARGCTATLGNFVSPSLTASPRLHSLIPPAFLEIVDAPYQEFTDLLQRCTHPRVSVEDPDLSCVTTGFYTRKIS